MLQGTSLVARNAVNNLLAGNASMQGSCCIILKPMLVQFVPKFAFELDKGSLYYCRQSKLFWAAPAVQLHPALDMQKGVLN